MSVRIFISWSGDRSYSYAKSLRKLIRCCFTDSTQFLSKEIAKGAHGFNEIADSLNSAKVGIVCLSSENKVKPWIQYESGALASGTVSNRVCTFLIDFDSIESSNPLSVYQNTKAHDRDEVRTLLDTINDAYGENKRLPDELDESFDLAWPVAIAEFEKAKSDHDSVSTTPKNSPPSRDAILNELLIIARENLRILRTNKNNSYSNKQLEEISKQKIAMDRAAKYYSQGQKLRAERELIDGGYTPDMIDHILEMFEESHIAHQEQMDDIMHEQQASDHFS